MTTAPRHNGTVTPSDPGTRTAGPDPAVAVRGLVKRYPKAVVRKFYPGSHEVTEGDAVIAYLQMLGTLVDFNQFDDKASLR